MTKGQAKYLQLLVDRQNLDDEIEKLRLKLARQCRHPNTFLTTLAFRGHSVGMTCTICKLVKYDSGIWTLQPIGEVVAKAACKHPSEFVEDYTWEHDSGYGRQTMITGEHCLFCGSRKSWKSSSLWITAEVYARPRKDDY